MKKIFVFLIPIFIFCLSCQSRDEKDNTTSIVGVWVVKEKPYSDGTGDTIVFTNDNRIEKYFANYEKQQFGYEISDDTLFTFIKSDDFYAEQDFKYVIQESKLIIFAFTYPYSAVQVARENVVFEKAKNKSGHEKLYNIACNLTVWHCQCYGARSLLLL